MPATGPTAVPPRDSSPPPEAPLGSGGGPPSSRHRRLLVLACAAVPLAALLPAAPGAFTRFHPLRLAVAAVAVLLTIALATFTRGGAWQRRGPRVTSWAAAAALLWLGWSVLSVGWSPAPGAGLLTLAAYGLGLIWIVLVRAVLSPASVEVGSGGVFPRPLVGASLALLVALLVAGATLAGLALLQRAGHARLGLHRVTATLGNPNHVAVALVALLPAALWLGRAARESRGPVLAPAGQVFAITWAAFLLLGIRATGCQAAWLAVAALALFTLLTWPALAWRRRLVVAGGATVALLGFAWAALPSSALLAGARGRLLIARFGLDVVLEAPVQGAGLGGFPHRVAWVQGAHLAREPGPWSPLMDAHHQALMVAGETGLVGLALAGLAFVLVIREIWARRRLPEAQAALAAWMGLAVFSLSETALRDVGVWLLALAWLAVGLGPRPVSAASREGLGARLARRPWLAWLGDRPEGPGPVASAWRLAPVTLAALACFVTVGDARADHLHAQGLALLAKADHGAERATLLRVLRAYDHALVSSLDPGALHLDRALVLQALGDPARAALAARAAFAARPGPDRALLLGDLAAAADRLPEAIVWYHRAVDLHPRYARARNNLAVALLRAGHSQVGCATLRRALSLRPFDPIIRGNWRTLCRPRPAKEITKTAKTVPAARVRASVQADAAPGHRAEAAVIPALPPGAVPR